MREAGRYEEAAATFRALLRHEPRAPQTLAMLGSCLVTTERHEEALGVLEDLLAVRPDDLDGALPLR